MKGFQSDKYIQKCTIQRSPIPVCPHTKVLNHMVSYHGLSIRAPTPLVTCTISMFSKLGSRPITTRRGNMHKYELGKEGDQFFASTNMARNQCSTSSE